MKKVKTIKINKLFIFCVVFIFLCLIYKLIYISTHHVMVGDETIHEYATARHTIKKEIVAQRGTIFSESGDVLAKDVNSYTVIAYLESSRTTDQNNPHHVIDKEMTAEKLSTIINMTPEKILKLLNTKIKNCDDDGTCKETIPYQVELGPGGRGISELTKSQIEDLDLPGIDFLSSTKRYYPNGDFLSYTLGYVKREESGRNYGEMGIELYFNDELTGKNGYIEYQSDPYGYQITGMPNIEQKATPGNDIYLTIDSNIQMFTEQAVTTLESSKPEWATVAVMEAKTGKILGVASTPSFNNNTLEIKSYYDPFVSYNYEPGSTMKIFSFLAAMENGIYDGKSKYKSGQIKVDDAIIKDWNKYGWGTITYDEGFMGSSNVAASKIALDLGRSKLKDFYSRLGFGSSTDITLPNELEGVINFRYNTEIASAAFGQGISVTAIQMLQALSVVSNNGVMLQPYIVSKIVNSETNEVVEEFEKNELGQVADAENVKYIIDLMRGVVDGRSRTSTGTGYYIKGYDLVGKTGTAEIASTSGGYLRGSTNYVRSFAGIFPGKDPQIVVYVAASKISNSNKIKTTVKDLVKNVGTYLNIYGKSKDKDSGVVEISNYVNKKIEEVSTSLEGEKINIIILGDGDKVINQYPKNTTVNLGSNLVLLTNSSEYNMPNIKGWSRADVVTLCNLLNINPLFNGNGYVSKYSIKEGEVITKNSTIEITLEDKYNKSKEETKEESKKKIDE